MAHAPTPPPAEAPEAPSAAAARALHDASAHIMFTTPAAAEVTGAALTCKVEVRDTSVLEAGAWVGLHRIGEASERVGAACVDLMRSPQAKALVEAAGPDAVTALQALHSQHTFDLTWESGVLPSDPGRFGGGIVFVLDVLWGREGVELKHDGLGVVAGLHELRLFASPGFDRLIAISRPFALVHGEL